jgi:hypothetical protein
VRREAGRPYDLGPFGGGPYGGDYGHGRHKLVVAFTGTPGKLQYGGTVYLVMTFQRGVDTPSHLGVGSTFASVKREYPKAQCAQTAKLRREDAAGCTVFTKLGKKTILNEFLGESHVNFVSVVTG